MKNLISLIDEFIPEAEKFERAELGLARNFVFTHLFGPLLSQPIVIFLYITDPQPGWACWALIVCTWLFWLLPFVLKYTRNLQLAALISVELLAFTSLFGAFHYGGASSPFLPWLIVTLLLGFFYLSKQPYLVVGLLVLNLGAFFAAYLSHGFPQRVPLSQLAPLGWVSILSAAICMSWMAIYYANIMSMRSALERETAQHRSAAIRLRHAKELADAANRSKSIFLAKMSHELRTPLNAVIGYSEMLLETCEPNEQNEHKRVDLARINAAGKHLLALVADVLDLSKIEATSIELRIARFDLAEFAQDVVATMKRLAAEKGNSLALDCVGRLGIVTTDPTKLRQIVMNLISNAAKFTEAGSIVLTVRRDCKSGVDWIEIQVRDTGIGIAADQMHRLFQNFGQASAGIAAHYGGTGLGLAISQQFCVLMGGSIGVTSEAGHGSCFTVRVLAELRPEEEAAADPATICHPLPAVAI